MLHGRLPVHHQKGPCEVKNADFREQLHRQRVRFCAAKAERRHIQRRDHMIACGDNRRFRPPQGIQGGSKLVVDGEIVTDSKLVLENGFLV